jgi:hypothetical protein
MISRLAMLLTLYAGARKQKWYGWMKAWTILPPNKASEPENGPQLNAVLESPGDLFAGKCEKDCEKALRRSRNGSSLFYMNGGRFCSTPFGGPKF